MNFDRVAPYYDQIARLVFGKSYLSSRRFHLKEISNVSSVLVIGGGTCADIKILEASKDVAITLVEPSKKMMSRAKKNLKYHQVQFEDKDFLHFHSDHKYDLVVSNYFLDLFDDQQIEVIIRKISGFTHVNSSWIVTDFMILNKGFPRLLSSFLIKSMIIFFKVFSGLKINNLSEIRPLVEKNGWVCQEMKTWYFGIIWSGMFRKQS